MSPPRQAKRTYVGHALRVAVVVTVLVAVVYAAAMVLFDAVDANRLVTQVDTHLSERLVSASHQGRLLPPPGAVDRDRDLDAAPVVLWRIDGSGRPIALSDATPKLRTTTWPRSARPTTVRLGSTSFRLETLRVGPGWLVAGQSLADVARVQRILLAAEVIAAPVILAVVFFGTFVIGIKASDPVEQARRRQLEFTADASHELRTPLSVIEAEVGLSLSAQRDAGQYREALERVRGESRRLRRIVEDLLWLARFDSEPPPPSNEPVDLATIAEDCKDRFDAVAASQGIDLSVRTAGDAQALVTAPAAWIDRLTGVLVDNACRYAGRNGAVVIVVKAQGNLVSLAVDDSGPGIPLEERSRLFDRFYRATDEGTGAGLGLAIADSVVRSTRGRWLIAEAPHGGAHMEVSWHRSGPRETGPRPIEAVGDSGDPQRREYTPVAG